MQQITQVLTSLKMLQLHIIHEQRLIYTYYIAYVNLELELWSF